MQLRRLTAQGEAARSLIHARRPADAIKLLLEALSSSPDDSTLFCLLAQACTDSGRPEEALHAADQAASLVPNDEWPHRLRSIALRHLNRNGEAVEAGLQSVQLAPTLGVAHQSLCDAYLAAKQNDQAFLEGVEALRLAPDAPYSHDVMGRCFLARRQFKDAEKEFRRALEIHPNFALAHNNLGVALQGQGRLVEAIAAADAAARIDPSGEQFRRNVYRGTRLLIGVGTGILLVTGVLIALLAIVVGSRSVGLAALLAGLIVVGIVLSVIRSRDRRLPKTALAYYHSVRRRKGRR